MSVLSPQRAIDLKQQKTTMKKMRREEKVEARQQSYDDAGYDMAKTRGQLTPRRLIRPPPRN